MAADGVPRQQTHFQLSLRDSSGSPFEWLAPRVAKWPGGDTALCLAASALADSTSEYYQRHWRSFCTWCASAGLDPMPATPQMVFAYVGHLAERGTIAASSLKPYLSAINSRHADAELPRPALGHLVTRAKQGMAAAQSAMQTQDTRFPLPAAAAVAVLEHGLAVVRRGRGGTTPVAHAARLRACYALVLTFLFMGRQDSSVSLLDIDHGIDGDFIWLRLTEKQKRRQAYRRVVRLPLRWQPPNGHRSRLPDVATLGRAYGTARTACIGASRAPAYFFQLPGEPQPRTQSMSAWIAAALDAVGVHAPPGFTYLGHSLRSGGASAAEAIGVPAFRANWLGGWAPSSRVREQHYLDPSVLPSPEAHQLLGWLAQGAYETTMPSWTPTQSARDTDAPGEWEA
jgi:hypothetical protein